MTHVVTEACIACKYTDCVDVCPVDAFRAGMNMLVIDPDECIDCGVCIPECPLEAILAAEDVPATQIEYTELNARLAKRWPLRKKKCAPLPEAEAMRQQSAKRALLDERAEPSLEPHTA